MQWPWQGLGRSPSNLRRRTARTNRIRSTFSKVQYLIVPSHTTFDGLVSKWTTKNCCRERRVFFYDFLSPSPYFKTPFPGPLVQSFDLFSEPPLFQYWFFSIWTDRLSSPSPFRLTPISVLHHYCFLISQGTITDSSSTTTRTTTDDGGHVSHYDLPPWDKGRLEYKTR